MIAFQFVKDASVLHAILAQVGTIGDATVRASIWTAANSITGMFPLMIAFQSVKDAAVLQAALAQVYGSDINPYAVAIARFRLHPADEG